LRRDLVIELAADCPELTLLEFDDSDPAPAFCCANERGWLPSRVTLCILRR
jgi:hypothetical protein